MHRAPLCLIVFGWIVIAHTALAARHPSPPSASRLQPDLVCLDPSAEFPVACDEDDD